MTTKKHRVKPGKKIASHHIAWATACLVLLAVMSVLWLNSQTLGQKTAALEQRLTQATTDTCTVRGPWAAGTTRKFSLTSQDMERSYLVHLPTDFNPAQYYPAVVFFPGKGASALIGQASSQLDKLPAIVIYPEPTHGKDGALSWQGAPYSSGVNDVQFVSDVLDKAEGQLCIQKNRIYAAGMSNGGGMAALLSCQLSDRFAAYGVVAGAMYYPEGNCLSHRPTPIITLHSDTDTVVPYYGSETRGLPSIDNWVESHAKNNGCQTTPATTYLASSATITTWQHCQNNATVQKIRLHNTGHLWAPDAPSVLWQFFARHSL